MELIARNSDYYSHIIEILKCTYPQTSRADHFQSFLAASSLSSVFASTQSSLVPPRLDFGTKAAVKPPHNSAVQEDVLQILLPPSHLHKQDDGFILQQPSKRFIRRSYSQAQIRFANISLRFAYPHSFTFYKCITVYPKFSTTGGRYQTSFIISASLFGYWCS